MENKPINEGNEGKKKVLSGVMIAIISFLITFSVIVLLVCWWSNTYTPPKLRMMNEEKVVVQKNKEARKNKNVFQKLPPKKEIAKASNPVQEVVISPQQVIPEKKVTQVVSADWEPVINVSGDIRNELPNIRAVPSEARAIEAGVTATTRVVVVEAPARQNRYDYVYGAYGNNSGCGWWNNNCGGWNGGAGIYCNSFGTGPWPCQQLQNNFVSQQPFVVHHHHRHRGHHPHHASPPPAPPPVVIPPPSPPPHHHHHEAPVSPASSGGPLNPGGSGN